MLRSQLKLLDKLNKLKLKGLSKQEHKLLNRALYDLFGFYLDSKEYIELITELFHNMYEEKYKEDPYKQYEHKSKNID